MELAAFGLAGRVVVVTGGTKGIGRAVAEALARAGARVIVSYAHDASAAAATAAAGEGAIVAVRADAAAVDTPDRLVTQALTAHGRLDGWVNCAGADILTGAARDEPFAAKLDRLLAVDLVGSLRASRAAGAAMRQQGGSIVNIAWDHVLQGYASDYGVLFGAAKGGVVGFSTSLARQLAPSVRVNVVAPGWIRTAWGDDGPGAAFTDRIVGMTPAARWGEPRDVAAAVLYLVSDAGAFITGQVVRVNGGVVMG